jgi:hypothetical protein
MAESRGVRQVVDHLVELGRITIAHVDETGSGERRRALSDRDAPP